MMMNLATFVSEIDIYMQSGLAKESIHLDCRELNLRTLKEIACSFIDRNVNMKHFQKQKQSFQCLHLVNFDFFVI